MELERIKYRAKDKFTGRWVYGFPRKTGLGNWVIYDGDRRYCILPETLGQYTGLKDKAGKEVYEGDIITVNGKYPRVVLWDKMCWSLMPTEYFHDKYFWIMNLQHPGVDWWEEFSDEFNVIGNIIDNKNLLEQ
ncbi:MAG: YopX family protein [Muribaculaceae bacterium]|nr:YopX family protein [Muribaculaceae bacterium]